MHYPLAHADEIMQEDNLAEFDSNSNGNQVDITITLDRSLDSENHITLSVESQNDIATNFESAFLADKSTDLNHIFTITFDVSKEALPGDIETLRLSPSSDALLSYDKESLQFQFKVSPSIAPDSSHIFYLTNSSVSADVTIDPKSKAGYIEERKDQSTGNTETLRSFGFTNFPQEIKLGESFVFDTKFNTSAHISYPKGTFPPCLDLPSSEPDIYHDITLFSESWHTQLNSNAGARQADSSGNITDRFLAHHCDSPQSRTPMNYDADAFLSISYHFVKREIEEVENGRITHYHYAIKYSGASSNKTQPIDITVRDAIGESGQISSNSNGLAVSAGEQHQIGSSDVTLFYEVNGPANNTITAFVNPELGNAGEQDSGEHVLNLVKLYAPQPYFLNKEQSRHYDEYTLKHESNALGLSRRILSTKRVGPGKKGEYYTRVTTTEESMGFTKFPERIELGSPFTIEVGLRAQTTMTNRWCVGSEVRTPQSFMRLRTRDTWVRSAYRTSYHAHDAIEFSCADTSQLLSAINLGADSTMRIECTPLENNEVPGETVAAAYRVLYEYDCKVESETLTEHSRSGNKVAFYWPLVESDENGNFKSENDIALNSHVLIETGFSSIPGPNSPQEIVLEYAPSSSAISASPYKHPFELKPDWQQPGADNSEANNEDADRESDTSESEDDGDTNTGVADADETLSGDEDSSSEDITDTDTSSTAIDPNKPDIAQHIADWIAKAEPPINATENAQVRYNNRGNFVGRTQTGTIEDRHDTGAFNPIFLWDNKRTLDSVNHCTMEEYVNKQMAGKGIEDCVGRYKPSADKPDSDKQPIPNVIGLDVREAAEQIQTATGIRPRVILGKPAPNSNQSRTVANVKPKPGATVDKDDKITITVYAPAQAVIPNVIGLDAKAAVAKIKSATNIRPRVVLGKPASSTKQARTVASVSPKPGTKVSNQDKITVTVFAPAKAVPPKPDPKPDPQEITPPADKPGDKPADDVTPNTHPCLAIKSDYNLRDATWSWYSFLGVGGSNGEINGLICTSQGYYTYKDNAFRSYDCGKDFTSLCVKANKFNAEITKVKPDGKGSVDYSYQYANGGSGWGKRTPNTARTQKPDSTEENTNPRSNSEADSPTRVDHPTEGIYTTTYGDMDFKTSGPHTATYKNDGGRIIGSLSSTTLEGIWIEKSSNQKCKMQRDGSYYWGLVKFTFSSDYNEFNGLWSYCDKPVKNRHWSGKRKQAGPNPANDEILGSGFEPGMDRPGADIKAGFHTTSAQACQKECQNNPKCKSFTWVKPNTIQGPKGRCWIKHSVPKAVKRSCCISGVISKLTENTGSTTSPSKPPNSSAKKPENNSPNSQGQWGGAGKGIDKIEGEPVLGNYKINFNIAANNTVSGKISFDKGLKPVSLSGKVNSNKIALQGSHSEIDDDGYTFTYTVKLSGTLNDKQADGKTVISMPDLVCIAEAIGGAIGSAIVPFGEAEDEEDVPCPITSYKGNWSAQKL